MRSSTCLCNSRRALYRVFSSPAELRPRQFPLTIHQPFTTTARPTTTKQPSHIATQTRSFKKPVVPRDRGDALRHTAHSDGSERSYESRFMTQKQYEDSHRGRLPQDHEITDPKIMVVENNILEGPLSPRTVMAELTPEESLRMFVPYIASDPKEEIEMSYAICKIVNKRDEFQRLKEVREKAKGRAKPKTKLLEMSWAIGGHDLETKVRRLTDFLGKGFKVEITIGKKKGSKKEVAASDAKAVLNKVEEEIENLGAKSTRQAGGEVGATMMLMVEPKATK